MPLTVAATQALGGSAPNPAYSGTFIPEIWSGKLLEKFYATTVLAAISNTQYEGELKNQGDKVIIRTTPTITIRDYEIGQTLQVERPASNVVEMVIDKANYFNLILDDVMAHQSDINMLSMWAHDASEQMKIVVDRAVLTDLRNTPATGNRGGTAGAVSGSINLGATTTPLAVANRNPGSGQVEVIDLIVRMGQALDEQNIPGDGRWMVIPAWMASKIKTSELRDASLSGDGQSMLRNGRLGQIDRFTIYSSNLLPMGTAAGLAAGETAVYAGHPNALSFAAQFSKIQSMDSEQTFGRLMRGLQVYGYKVLDPTAITQAVVTPA
jgi:hypothetical protein